jgi:hypothetical protein
MNAFYALASMVLIFGAVIAALAFCAIYSDRRHPS